MEGFEVNGANGRVLEGGQEGGVLVVQVDEGLQEVCSCPGVPRVVFGCQTACMYVSILVRISYEDKIGNTVPSVKSIDTRCAPASKHPRISFSHYDPSSAEG